MAFVENRGSSWKPIGELSAEDLHAHAVWEWKTDEGTEFVRSTAFQHLSEQATGPICIALTRFTVDGGTVAFGYCSPADASGLDYVQPVILTPHGGVPLYPPSQMTDEHVQSLCEAFAVDRAGLFPMLAQCLVPVDGEYFSARVGNDGEREV